MTRQLFPDIVLKLPLTLSNWYKVEESVDIFQEVLSQFLFFTISISFLQNVLLIILLWPFNRKEHCHTFTLKFPLCYFSEMIWRKSARTLYHYIYRYIVSTHWAGWGCPQWRTCSVRPAAPRSGCSAQSNPGIPEMMKLLSRLSLAVRSV